MRMKAGGGTAGHNGLKSIGAAIGPHFRRLRIGVGHPGVKEMVPAHVLHDFAKADKAWLEPMIDAIAENAPLLAEDKDSTFANRIHEAIEGESDPRKKKAEPPAEEPAAAPSSPAAGKKPAKASTEPEKTKPASGGALARGLKRLFDTGKG
jgi:peptidyl-tRNA hydrolase, PTH1 family